MKKTIKSLFKKHWLTILIIISILPFYFAFGCPIRFLTGISCMGCGMSRAAEALLHFDFSTALRMHPLIFIMPAAAVLIILHKRLPRKLINSLTAILCALMIIVYLIRLFSGSYIVYIDLHDGFIYKCVEHFINFIT